MKFSVKTVLQHSPRLGELSQIGGKPDVCLETPLALLHTQAGHIPHITHEVLKLVTQEPHFLQIPVVSMHNYLEAIHLYNGRVADFVGSKDSLTCVTLNDPSNLMKQGHHNKVKVPIFTKQGKVMYDSENYMDMVEKLRPDMYIILSDGDTNMTSSNKRVSKAVENTVSFNQKCIERHKKSEKLQDVFVIAPIAGGYCVKSRKKCLELLLPNEPDIQGYLIDGLHNNGPEVELISFSEVKPIVECVIAKLPPGKLRAIQGCWSPLNIIKLVNSGIDIFDTSYCRILTERSAALTFAIDAGEASESYEINLRHGKFSEDFQPLLKECKCIACQGYSRAYIHHLLTVQELLGSVLIMVHNVHHMLRFFQKIRDSVRENKLNELEDRVAEQIKLCHCQKEQPESSGLTRHSAE